MNYHDYEHHERERKMGHMPVPEKILHGAKLFNSPV
jgi:hypothetical protein